MGQAPSSWAAQDRKGVYAELEHPADLFLEIEGDDLSTLFDNALFALYDHVAVLAEFATRCEITIAVRPASLEEALRALLAEALYRFETEGFVAIGAEVNMDTSAQSDIGVTAHLWGENAGKRRHALLTEIKAVTYHRLSVARTPSGTWRATVLFDV